MAAVVAQAAVPRLDVELLPNEHGGTLGLCEYASGAFTEDDHIIKWTNASQPMDSMVEVVRQLPEGSTTSYGAQWVLAPFYFDVRLLALLRDDLMLFSLSSIYSVYSLRCVSGLGR